MSAEEVCGAGKAHGEIGGRQQVFSNNMSASGTKKAAYERLFFVPEILRYIANPFC